MNNSRRDEDGFAINSFVFLRSAKFLEIELCNYLFFQSFYGANINWAHKK